MNSKRVVEDLAIRCGLKVSTVQNLIDQNWTYIETIQQPVRWVHPALQLTIEQGEK